MQRVGRTWNDSVRFSKTVWNNKAERKHDDKFSIFETRFFLEINFPKKVNFVKFSLKIFFFAFKKCEAFKLRLNFNVN